MNDARVSMMPTSKSAVLGMLRQHDGIEVATDREQTWVRVRKPDESIGRALQTLPGAEHFDVSPDGRLFPVGQRVPVGRLPDLDWCAITRFVRPALPQSSLAGRSSSRCRLALRRSTRLQTPNVLITELSVLVGYGGAAAEVRLNRWRFAVCENGRAAVWGEPLPSLPGQMYVERDRVAVPAGWQIVPALETRVLADVMGIGPGELVLVRPDASVERIDADNFVRATRSALRASVEASADD